MDADDFNFHLCEAKYLNNTGLFPGKISEAVLFIRMYCAMKVCNNAQKYPNRPEIRAGDKTVIRKFLNLFCFMCRDIRRCIVE